MDQTLFSWIEKQRLQNEEEECSHEHYIIRNEMLDGLVEEIHKLNAGETGVHIVMQELIDKAVEQIKEDMGYGVYEPLEELLKRIPIKYLEGFLSEVDTRYDTD